MNGRTTTYDAKKVVMVCGSHTITGKVDVSEMMGSSVHLHVTAEGKDVIVMGFDCNKWALEELLAGNWNYDGQCNPFQASYIDAIIKDLENGKTPAEKTIIMDEKGFDASTITTTAFDQTLNFA